MPIALEFEYLKPKTLAEALPLLKKGVFPLAGGTDLIVWIKEGARAPKAVLDLKGLRELQGIRLQGKTVFVGAAATFTEIIESPVVRDRLPLLWQCARALASPGIRNRATLAGNLCSAVPSLDSGPALLAYEASVLVQGISGKREIAAESWFTGPKKTALRTGELVLGVKLPLPGRHGARYEKLGRYRGEDLAQVGVGALALPGGEYRVSFCAVGPVPSRAKSIERALKGRGLSGDSLREALGLVPSEIRPISDLRAGKEYRLRMAKVLLERALKAAEEGSR
jgi:carbon-monoxide dehydrogenase medium subunit